MGPKSLLLLSLLGQTFGRPQGSSAAVALAQPVAGANAAAIVVPVAAPSGAITVDITNDDDSYDNDYGYGYDSDSNVDGVAVVAGVTPGAVAAASPVAVVAASPVAAASGAVASGIAAVTADAPLDPESADTPGTDASLAIAGTTVTTPSAGAMAPPAVSPVAIVAPAPLVLADAATLADQSAPGPYNVTVAVSPISGDVTLYIPTGFANGTNIPLLAWANPGCVVDGTLYRSFLSEIASQGYLVVAPGAHPKAMPPMGLPPMGLPPMGPRPGAFPRMGYPPRPFMGPQGPWARGFPKGPWARGVPRGPWAGPRRNDDTLDSSINSALKWVRASGFPLNWKKIAVAGHDCGASDAISTLAADSQGRITTAIIFSGPGARNETLDHFAAPSLWVTGGVSDYSTMPATLAYAYLTTANKFIPTVAASINAAHQGTFRTSARGGADAEIAVKWLDAWLKSSQPALDFFAANVGAAATARGWNISANALPATVRR